MRGGPFDAWTDVAYDDITDLVKKVKLSKRTKPTYLSTSIRPTAGVKDGGTEGKTFDRIRNQLRHHRQCKARLTIARLNVEPL